jgi:hypothetical protein
MPRLSSRQRRRFTVLGGLATLIFLYLYLSTDTLSASPFDTTQYARSKQKVHEPPRQRPPLTLAENQIQFDFKANGRQAGDPAKAKAVVDAMKKSFWNYKAQAWGHDEIRPISGDSSDTK